MKCDALMYCINVGTSQRSKTPSPSCTLYHFSCPFSSNSEGCPTCIHEWWFLGEGLKLVAWVSDNTSSLWWSEDQLNGRLSQFSYQTVWTCSIMVTSDCDFNGKNATVQNCSLVNRKFLVEECLWWALIYHVTLILQ